EGSLAGRKSTQQNLAAVLMQVDLDRPAASRLLTKAVSVHGELAQPALKSREIPAFRTLEEWVRVTLETNPQLCKHPAAPASPLQVVERPGIPAPVTPKAESTLLDASTGRPITAEKTTTSAATPSAGADVREIGTVAPPPPSSEPVDPFDPVIFNRQM